jgi:hypothetical protein
MDISTAASLGSKFIAKLLSTLSLSNNKLIPHLKSRRCFRHSTKLAIQNQLLLQLSPLSCDLQFALAHYFSSTFNVKDLPSESAFVQARGKFSHTIFDYISKEVAAFFEELLPPATYKGYRLLGGDGSTCYLPQTQACKKAFGSVSNQHGSQTYARFLVITDLLNKTCLYSKIGRCNESELSLMLDGLNSLPPKTILILDRLFPSSGLFYEMAAAGVDFIVRADADFNNTMVSFVEQGLTDAIYEFPITERAVTSLKKRGHAVTCHSTIRVRYVRVTLDNGNFEYLVTSMVDNNFTESDFKYLYNCRWGVEGFIDVFKNKIRLEQFSGHKPETVRQDFYAGIAKINIQTFFHALAASVLKESPKQTVHEYQPNMALCTSLVSKLIPQCRDNTAEIEEKVLGLLSILVRFPQPKRLGRSYPRVFKCHKARGRCYYNSNYKTTH